MASRPPTFWQITTRIAAGILGGYAFTWGFAALGAMLLLAAGMAFEEATSLIAMLGFLVYLSVFCWAFAAISLTQVWGWLAGGGAVMTLAGWLLSRTLT